MYLHLDLCCGLGGWQAPFKEAEAWRSVGVDIREDLAPDVVGDVRQLPLSASPTLVTASPPCPEFSTAPVKPFADRNPDRSLWYACREAVAHLDPEWYVIENVAGAQHWFGEADKSCHPYHLWGRFPPFDVGDLPDKGRHGAADGHGLQSAQVPYALADALRHAVETWA